MSETAVKKNGGARPGAGRPPGTMNIAPLEVRKDLAILCREKAQAIMDKWWTVFMLETTSHDVLIRLGNSILDRGFGRPHQSVHISGHLDGEVKHSFEQFADIVDVEAVKTVEKK